MRFRASIKTENPNGSIGWAPGGMMDCLGPYAKVQNCPVKIGDNEVARLTCYATGYANSWFSIPAYTRYRGRYIKGYLTGSDTGTEFRVMDSHKTRMEK